VLANVSAVAGGELLPLRPALDALDSYGAGPDDPDRMVPNPARKAAAARVRQAEAAVQAAEAAARDVVLLLLRSPAPARPPASPTRWLTPWPRRWRPPGASWTRRTRRGGGRPGSVLLGALAPDMVRHWHDQGTN